MHTVFPTNKMGPCQEIFAIWCFIKKLLLVQIDMSRNVFEFYRTSVHEVILCDGRDNSRLG